MILIVDDHVDTCRVLVRLMQLAGLDGASAHSAAEARAVLARGHADAIVLDYHMPDATGVDLLRQLRRNPDTAGVPVVMYSAFAEPAARAEAERLGARAWLTKGAQTWPDLLAAIRAATAGAAPCQ